MEKVYKYEKKQKIEKLIGSEVTAMNHLFEQKNGPQFSCIVNIWELDIFSVSKIRKKKKLSTRSDTHETLPIGIIIQAEEGERRTLSWRVKLTKKQML